MNNKIYIYIIPILLIILICSFFYIKSYNIESFENDMESSCKNITLRGRANGVQGTTLFTNNNEDYCCLNGCFNKNIEDCGNDQFGKCQTGYYETYVKAPKVKKETTNNFDPNDILSRANILLKLEDDTIDSGLSHTDVTTVGNVKFTNIADKKCVLFNNSFNDYLKFKYTNTDKFSLSYWIYVIDNGGYTALSISSGNFANIDDPVFQADFYNGNVIVNFVALPVRWTATTSYNYNYVGKWTHIVYTCDQSSLKTQLFVNGKFISTATGWNRLPTHPNTYIMGRSGDWGRAFYGYIRYFCQFDYVLSSEEVKSLYNITLSTEPPYDSSFILNKEYKSDKLLNRGNVQLYNSIFCNLITTDEGFYKCKDCGFPDLKPYSIDKTDTEDLCLKSCNDDKSCTSYTYNENSGKCMLYNGFPNKINKSLSGNNSGYTLKGTYNYKVLTDKQKDNVKLKCADQILNDKFIKNNDVEIMDCLQVNENGTNTEFNVDPKCLYKIYKDNDIKTSMIDNTSYIGSVQQQNDSVIEKYNCNYKKYYQLKVQNENKINQIRTKDKNNVLSVDQIHNPTYIDSMNKTADPLLVSLQKINNTLGIVEKFDNKQIESTNTNFFIIVIFIVFIFIIISFFSIKNN